MEEREALRLLEAIEYNKRSTPDLFALVEQSDPALVYFIVTWLRTRYANHSAADGVIGRIVALCQAYPATTRILKKGGSDAIVSWFEDTYEYRDFESTEFIALVVEKLES